MHTNNTIYKGKKLGEAEKVLIMLHGRGASAEDILSLAAYFSVEEYTLIAPQATTGAWYPKSFLAPPAENEPWLSSALALIKSLVAEAAEAGISPANIYFLGFSQGACLTLEFVARNVTQYGGVVAFTGGLIGDKLYMENYKGNFEKTNIYIGTSDPDAHVPVERVDESVKVLQQMDAAVTVEIFKNMGHTINQNEIDSVNKLIFVK